MTNLERELRGLAPFVERPPERDLAPAVRARIGARRPHPGRLVLALAVIVLAVAVAFAVPPARSAILRWLGLGNARIEFVDRLPNVRTRRPLDKSPATSRCRCRRPNCSRCCRQAAWPRSRLRTRAKNSRFSRTVSSR